MYFMNGRTITKTKNRSTYAVEFISNDLEPPCGYGPHLTIDGYNCDKKKLVDFELIHKFLTDLPAQIGMTKLIPPYVIKYNWGKIPNEWGITGIVIIAESHISVHTYPEQGIIFLDVFSCKEFDVNKTIQIIGNTFNIKEKQVSIVKRGLKFPRTKNASILTN